MASEHTQHSIHLLPESVTVWSEEDSDGDLRVLIQGEVQLRTDCRYDRVRIEYTVRSTEGRVLAREDSGVDLDYAVNGQANFSNTLYIKPALGKDAASIELRASAQIIDVDQPIKLDIKRSK